MVKDTRESGDYIFRNISQAKDKVKELEQALSAIEDDLGRSNAAYSILSENLVAAEVELSKRLRQQYHPHVAAPVRAGDLPFSEGE